MSRWEGGGLEREWAGVVMLRWVVWAGATAGPGIYTDRDRGQAQPWMPCSAPRCGRGRLPRAIETGGGAGGACGARGEAAVSVLRGEAGQGGSFRGAAGLRGLGPDRPGAEAEEGGGGGGGSEGEGGDSDGFGELRRGAVDGLEVQLDAAEAIWRSCGLLV